MSWNSQQAEWLESLYLQSTDSLSTVLFKYRLYTRDSIHETIHETPIQLIAKPQQNQLSPKRGWVSSFQVSHKITASGDGKFGPSLLIRDGDFPWGCGWSSGGDSCEAEGGEKGDCKTMTLAPFISLFRNSAATVSILNKIPFLLTSPF